MSNQKCHLGLPVARWMSTPDHMKSCTLVKTGTSYAFLSKRMGAAYTCGRTAHQAAVLTVQDHKTSAASQGESQWISSSLGYSAINSMHQ